MKNSTFDTLTAQSRAGAAAGVSPASLLPNPNASPVGSLQATGNANLFYQRVIVPAGKRYPFVISGDYVFVEGLAFNTYNADTTIPTIKSDTGQATYPLTQPGRDIEFGTAFNFVELDNTASAYDLIISLWIGFGKARKHRKDNALRFSAVTAKAGAYAANQIVGSQTFYTGALSPFNRWGVITKALVMKNNTTTANADFTLWLWALSQMWTDSAAFVFDDVSHYVGQNRFNSFVTGGAGSTRSICDISDIEIDIQGVPITATGAEGVVYGCLVANAAYVGTGETIGTYLYVKR